MQSRLTEGLQKGENMQVSNHVNSASYTFCKRSKDRKCSTEYSVNGELESAKPSKTLCSTGSLNYGEYYLAGVSQRVNRAVEEQIDFSRFAPYAPDEVKQAFIEASNEVSQTQNIKKEQEVVGEDTASLLTAESTSCTYPTANPKDDDIRYITWYTEEGIFCRKAGQTGEYEWSISFENKEQYNKVIELIGNFSSEWNLRFAAHENFWTDFLNDEIDMDEFMEFMGSTNQGVPDYSITVGDSMYIDKDKIQWAKYLNPLGDKFYTAEEFYKKQMEIVAANASKMNKISDPYEEIYKLSHPEYNGERIFCEYLGGSLYTANEIARVQWENLLKEQNLTEEEWYAQQAEWRARVGYPKN